MLDLVQFTVIVDQILPVLQAVHLQISMIHCLGTAIYLGQPVLPYFLVVAQPLTSFMAFSVYHKALGGLWRARYPNHTMV